MCKKVGIQSTLIYKNCNGIICYNASKDNFDVDYLYEDHLTNSDEMENLEFEEQNEIR